MSNLFVYGACARWYELEVLEEHRLSVSGVGTPGEIRTQLNAIDQYIPCFGNILRAHQSGIAMLLAFECRNHPSTNVW